MIYLYKKNNAKEKKKSKQQTRDHIINFKHLKEEEKCETFSEKN